MPTIGIYMKFLIDGEIIAACSWASFLSSEDHSVLGVSKWHYSNPFGPFRNILGSFRNHLGPLRKFSTPSIDVIVTCHTGLLIPLQLLCRVEAPKSLPQIGGCKLGPPYQSGMFSPSTCTSTLSYQDFFWISYVLKEMVSFRSISFFIKNILNAHDWENSFKNTQELQVSH